MVDYSEIKKTVLIVDDNPENIEVIAGILKQEGYKLKAATSGEETLRIAFSGTPPDLILLDIMMPGMNGYEVCARLKSDLRTRSIPIIFVTARISGEDEARGFAIGAIDYIHKPVGPEVIRARVSTHLRLADQNLELERRVAETTAEIEETRREIVRRLSVAGEFRDNDTGQHVMRVGRLTALLAEKSGLNQMEVSLLRDAAQMHDVGKIGIPDHILLKPGKYTPEERAIMETHCEIGSKIIGDHKSNLLKSARLIAIAHHEKWDGTGYPNRLSEGEIPFEARLTAVADVFDALISKRSYKEPWSLIKVYKYMEEESGKSFDPQIITLLLNSKKEIEKILEEHPIDN